MDYFRRKRVLTWQEAKDWIRRLGTGWVFRGQANDEHQLTTALERLEDVEDKPFAEERLLREFRRRARSYLQSQLVPNDDDYFGWLALMQHYGAPTRLQDWTHSPYVAAFFALEPRGEPLCDRALWAVNLQWIQEASIEALSKEVGVNDATLFVYTRQDKLVEKYVLLNPDFGAVPVEPRVYDARQSAQQALFMCPSNAKRSFVDNLLQLKPLEAQKSVIKLILSAEMRVSALRDLAQMNVTAATLFPGLDGFGRSLQTMLFDFNWQRDVFEAMEGGAAWSEAHVPARAGRTSRGKKGSNRAARVGRKSGG